MQALQNETIGPAETTTSATEEPSNKPNAQSAEACDVVCRPLTYKESWDVYEALQNACHPKSRLIAWGIRTVPEAVTPQAGNPDENASIHQSPFEVTPNSSGPQVRIAIVLDCEMVTCGSRQEVAFTSAVDLFSGEVLLNTFVQPAEKVTRWNTRWSGITSQKLNTARRQGNVLWGWKEARRALWSFANQSTVLIGHAIRNDLEVLKIIHPRIVDTSILTNEAVFRGGSNKRLWSLKNLSQTFLGRSIQTGKNGHDALEDAQATRNILVWCLLHPERLAEWALSAYTAVMGPVRQGPDDSANSDVSPERSRISSTGSTNKDSEMTHWGSFNEAGGCDGGWAGIQSDGW
ncbi:Exonuclease domain-containing protein [Penicillium ucsense]|uniref:Exonuclease domain-containing protein n=1 Tax=Penicillium ucsense TaxID=2839758 RepID=A0A8J8W0C6_9EURO|nr:Exonuclease domain-containing protein [Penicillium ucsense]KAF7733428.1 Exonuclease domain-containing protein [Penicillium ucsense]